MADSSIKASELEPSAWWYGLGRVDERVGNRDYANVYVANDFARFVHKLRQTLPPEHVFIIDNAWSQFQEEHPLEGRY